MIIVISLVLQFRDRKKLKKILKKVLTFRPGCSIIIHVAERYSKMAKRQRHVGA